MTEILIIYSVVWAIFVLSEYTRASMDRPCLNLYKGFLFQ